MVLGMVGTSQLGTTDHFGAGLCPRLIAKLVGQFNQPSVGLIQLVRVHLDHGPVVGHQSVDFRFDVGRLGVDGGGQSRFDERRSLAARFR